MSGGSCRKQVEAGRQAYVVYPVIEGAKDDQPELDFAQDEEPRIRMPRPGRKPQVLRLRCAPLRMTLLLKDEENEDCGSRRRQAVKTREAV